MSTAHCLWLRFGTKMHRLCQANVAVDYSPTGGGRRLAPQRLYSPICSRPPSGCRSLAQRDWKSLLEAFGRTCPCGHGTVGTSDLAARAGLYLAPCRMYRLSICCRLHKAVVIGSAVRMGQWLPVPCPFVERHSAVLKRVRTAAFRVHLLALGER
mgnify:CR=1 FL=1